MNNIIDSKDWILFKNYYSDYTIFDQFNFFRYEDIHTNILSSLFMINNPYNLGSYPLQKLLGLLNKKDKYKTNIKDKDIYDIRNINTMCQEVIDKNRLDLKIDFVTSDKKYSIILENKVLSIEHDNQCARYYNYYKNKNDDVNYIFVYLSLEIEPNISCDKYICINYQELISYVIEPCSYKYSDINPKIISLDTYLSSFSKLYEYFDNKYIIPITNYGKSLTINLYNSSDVFKSFIDDDFYRENMYLLNIYYYNLLYIMGSKLDNDFRKKIMYKLFNVYSTFNGKKVSYKECYLYSLKYLFDSGVIKSNEEIDLLNNCVYDKNYVIVSFDYDSLIHKDYYYLNNDLVGELKIDNRCLYYYAGNLTKEELVYFIDNINLNFNNVLKDIVEIN